jgi:hypothetical protein
VKSKGKMVVEVGGAKILLVDDGGALYAVSNKCSHLGLPLVGKTAVFQAEARARALLSPRSSFAAAAGAPPAGCAASSSAQRAAAGLSQAGARPRFSPPSARGADRGQVCRVPGAQDQV